MCSYSAHQNFLIRAHSCYWCMVCVVHVKKVPVFSYNYISFRCLFKWGAYSCMGAYYPDFTPCPLPANKSMADVRRLYFKLKEGVFDEKQLDKRSEKLDVFMREIFGPTARMVDQQKPRYVWNDYVWNGHPN